MVNFTILVMRITYTIKIERHILLITLGRSTLTFHSIQLLTLDVQVINIMCVKVLIRLNLTLSYCIYFSKDGIYLK